VNYSNKSLALSVVVVFGLFGCASDKHLVKLQSAKTITDTAPFKGAAGDIPYEFQERLGLEVGYNIQYVKLERFSGYKLTFIFRNKSTSTIDISPRIRLIDANGMIIKESSYDGVMAESAMMARTAIPQIPAIQIAQQPYGSYQSGTIQNLNTGNTYTYSGYSQPQPNYGASFAGGFAQGAALGAAIAGASERKYGVMMMEWLPRNWMRGNYTLEPNLATSGSILYSASSSTKLPLKIKLDIGTSEFMFETVSGS